MRKKRADNDDTNESRAYQLTPVRTDSNRFALFSILPRHYRKHYWGFLQHYHKHYHDDDGNETNANDQTKKKKLTETRRNESQRVDRNQTKWKSKGQLEEEQGCYFIFVYYHFFYISIFIVYKPNQYKINASQYELMSQYEPIEPIRVNTNQYTLDQTYKMYKIYRIYRIYKIYRET